MIPLIKEEDEIRITLEEGEEEAIDSAHETPAIPPPIIT